jgi:hypothetical protein
VPLFAPLPAPPLQPPPINLIRAARTPRDPDGTKWTLGFAYLPGEDVALGTFGTTCPGGAPVDLSTVPANPGVVEWEPVVAWAAFRCSAFGWQEIDWKGRLADLMDAALPKAVEHEFWTGASAAAGGLTNLALATPAATDLTPGGGAPSIKRAFGILEQALADCGAGARGMIHCRPEALPEFTQVRQEGNLLLTPRDTIVVPGTGYPNTGPTGAAPAAGNTWLYATGLVDVRLDDIYFPVDPARQDDFYELLDRGTNTITLRAERAFSASWDGICHFAVQAVLAT